MVLRNVPSTATFEEQRVEINELAADVEALDAAALKAESDTLQTVTDRGFTTDNPIKIENNAATAFVVEDASSNEKFVVDSVNGKINVGSSAGGASGIYLFHNNSGATPAITLDGATGSITADGSADFANGGASISSSGTGSFNLLSLKNVAGSIGGSGGVENWIGFKHGSTFGLNLKTAGTNAGYVGVNTTTPANRLDVNHPSSPGIRVGGDGGGGGYHLEIGQVNTNGSPGINATGTSTSLKFLLNNTEVARFNASGKFINVAGAEFGGSVQATSVNLQSSTTASWFQTGTSLGGSDYVWAVKNSSTNTWHGGLKTSSDLYLGGDITSDPKILLNGSNGSASFDETVTIGSGSAAPDDYGLIAYANANTLSNKSAVYARNLADGRNFTGDNAAGATTFELYASGQGNFGAASNSTGNNGVLVGGNNGTLNLYTDRYSTDCFQILNTSGSGTNIALKAYGNGNLEMAGTISDSKGDLRKIPFKQEANAYTLVAADAGKAIEIQGNLTVPNSVFSAGDTITIINDSSSDKTISKGTGLQYMFNTADGTNTNRTLGGRGMATIYFVNSTTCYISGSQLS